MTEDTKENWRAAAKRARESIHEIMPIAVLAGSWESVGGFRSEDQTPVNVYPITPSYMLAEFMQGHVVMPSFVAAALEITVDRVMDMLRGRLQFDFPLVEAAIQEHRIHTLQGFMSRPLPKEN